MTLNPSDRRLVLTAISIAIEQSHKAIQECHSFERAAFLQDAITERQRTLKAFEDLRRRLLIAEDGMH